MAEKTCLLFETRFAPPEKASNSELKAETDLFLDDTLLNTILGAVPDFILILNKYRQIVFANRACLEYLGEKDIS